MAMVCESLRPGGDVAGSEVLRADGLYRSFQVGGASVKAVVAVTLSVWEGEVVVLVGRSGSGKSTLLALCGGLDRPDRGQVEVGGEKIVPGEESVPPERLRNQVGWIFQTAGLLPLYSAVENVSLSLRLRGIPVAESLKQAHAALAAVGLAERSAHRAHELSGGEQQRVALVRALVKGPSLLLADEPTSQLDTDTGRGVLEVIRQAADAGTGVLLATHDNSACSIADRVLLMEDGRVRVHRGQERGSMQPS
ncbi:MAG: ABC transporter ATP-binding protein [Candidatus Dormibacter sp.]|uniref:ABC transporter ATP-binding protein n=1 Tax=Candidatus Dormibacter sp. TaxID=2973982 RepID=UPI000DB6CB52|nr:MAG: ABC transporter [Candidatus Dormibacteraeota bacterium]